MIKNYSTSIAEEKTVSEIMKLLADKGARRIQVEYDEQNRPKAVSFVIEINKTPVPFQLPCNFEGVYRSMAKAYTQYSARARFERDPKNRAQARRVAWRIIKDWIAAQMALIEAEQATLAEVFLPYMKMQGKTAFQYFTESVLNTSRALTEGTPEAE